jgi:hypothetical protein
MLNIKKITPLFTQLVTTADIYEENQITDGLIDTDKKVGTLKDIQKVVAVGGAVPKEITVNSNVCINLDRFARKLHKEGSLKDGVITDNPVTHYDLPIVMLDKVPHLILDTRDIEFVVNDYTYEPDIQEDIIVN